jgi:aminopeptidase N
MQIHFVRRGNTDLNYTHSNDLLLTIDLNKTLSIGESDTLIISYEGVPHSTGFGSFERSTHNGKPILWTQSVPYGVKDWWPGKQDLIDKIDSMDVYVTTPLGQLAASSGKLISITEVNGKLIHHWKHQYPIVSYLVAIAVTNYSSYKETLHLPNGDSIEFLNYVYPESMNDAVLMTPKHWISCLFTMINLASIRLQLINMDTHNLVGVAVLKFKP